jgi:hypothetical protein
LPVSRRTLVTFFDFPAEHWKHLRTTNVIESPFATVRLRERATRGAGSRTKGLLMAFKLLDMAHFAGGASMALIYCRWFVPARSSRMEFARIDRITLLTQLTTNRGKPPDHDQPIDNI